MSWLSHAWRRFWFAPVDARSLAVMRIALGIILVVNHLAFAQRLTVALGPDGPVPLSTAHDLGMKVRLSIYDLATTDAALWGIHLAGLVVLVLYTLGWRTTVTKWLALLAVVSLYHRDRWVMDSGDKLLRLSTLYMALVPCGAAWSLDSRRRLRRTGIQACALVPSVAHRLVQLQLAWMYFHAGWGKAWHGSWQQGTALYWTWSDTGLWVIPAVGEFMVDTELGRQLCVAGGYLAMSWELAFPLLVLWRRSRWPALLFGVLFHLQIAGLMGIATFSFAAVWGYLAYVRPDRLGSGVERLVQRLRPA